ncbi:MAG: molybdenum ABC transporter ATP-binding protein [Steroidobacteraceae bacterium]
MDRTLMLSVAVQSRRGMFELDVGFSMNEPGVLAIFGRSGCGKTTLVNVIAGLITAQRAQVTLAGERWVDSDAGVNLPPERRRIGYVFQEPRLFPHMSVRGNLLYGANRAPSGEDAKAVSIGFDEALQLLGLEPLMQRRPAQLSGGERQRVALGRALLSRPRLLLLDEPLASLDAARREEVLPYLEKLRERRIPMLYVSHQFDELLRLATQVIVLEKGRIVAEGDVAQVSRAPALRAIVGPDAIGAVIEGEVLEADPRSGAATLRVGAGVLHVIDAHAVVGARVRVQLLARDLILATIEPRGLSVRNSLRGIVQDIVHEPDADLVEVQVGEYKVLARITQAATAALSLQAGSNVWVLVKAVSLRPHG